MTPGDVLRSAAGYVRHGWTQEVFFHRVPQVGLHNSVLGLRETTFVCAIGSIDLALDAARCRYLQHPVMDWLRVAIGIYSITLWNDAHGQTAENVADALEYAALLADQYAAEQAAADPAHVLVDRRTGSIPSMGASRSVGDTNTSDMGGMSGQER